ncbi:MAG TPA: RsmE family RNA methyltransferase [Candidatus Izemoplasmatales bacterium]|nr:RsmE family RNA methyltransferase [Candidatus Izemoplasmatales bacterium]
MQRYFIDSSQIENTLVRVMGGDFHHMKNVMRFQTGESVIVNTYGGHAYRCEIKRFEHDQVLLEVKEKLAISALSFHLTLGMAMIKRDAFELTLKKTTELGVDGIIPLNTKRSIIHIKDYAKKKKRYQRICKESSEQSERSYVPTIHALIDLDALDVDGYEHLFCAYARGSNQHLKSSIKHIKSSEKTLVLIGPEGGFTEDEIKLLKNKGFQNISLGDTILRAETAAIYVTSVFRFMLGD